MSVHKPKRSTKTHSGAVPVVAVPPVGGPNVKKNKIFGVMTKRRWFGVCVFLLAMLWSYTIGPPLEESHIAARYFLDSTPYDYSTIVKEGPPELIDSLFRPLLFPDTFTWQVGSSFKWTEGPTFSGNSLLFSDTTTNRIFSWSKVKGVQIKYDNVVNLPEKELKKLAEPGPNGLLTDPNNPNILYICEHGSRQIIKLDMNTNQKVIIASEYEGKRLNSPNDLVLDPSGKYLYFTDPPFGFFENSKYTPDNHLSTTYLETKSDLGFSGVYRVKTDGSQAKNPQLLTKDIYRPNGIAFNSKKNLLYVTSCKAGEINLQSFELVDGGSSLKPVHHFTETNLEWKGTPVEGGIGCTDGLTLHPKGYVFATCPGGKICIINENTKKMDAVIKMADGVKLSNVLIGPDQHLYLTGNHTVWSIRLTPGSFQ